MPHFFMKLIAPRPTFAADMNDAEKALMQEHARYWKSRQDKGEVIVFGPVLDPNGAYGMGVVTANDDAGARAFADADPVIKSGLGFRCEISPMRAVTRDTPLGQRLRRIQMSDAAVKLQSDSAPEQELTDGFHLIIDALKLNGLTTIYDVPGIPVSDLLRMAQAEGLRVISFRHEQNAGNAAAIAGFLTKKPGVCITVSAPGFLNGLTALANATTNCFPMILISGSSEREIVDLQQGDYEEMDQLAIAKPLCKAAYRILHAQDIGIGVARAIRAAVSGRPGGVYLDLPGKLLAQVMDAEAGRKSLVKVIDAAPAQIPAPDAVKRALDVLKSAKRPLIILGKGAAYAQADDAIRALVEKSGAPFLPMSMGKGLLPDTHPQCAGAARSTVLKDSDVVLLIGARLNWLLSHGKGKTWGSAPKKFIQIDIEPKEMDSNVEIAAPVVGDIGSCVTALLQGMGANWPKAPADWVAAVSKKREENVAKMAPRLQNNNVPMDYHGALGVLRTVVKERPDAILVNEGANTLDLARGIIDVYQPRKRLDVGTWGVMGIGMGFAVGAAVETGKPVLAVVGDSAFGFSGFEVETICRYNLPVCVVVFNNNGIYRGTDVNPTGGPDAAPMVFVKDARYDKIMEAFGGVGVHATTPDELRRAVNAAMDSGKPTLINAVIDPAAGSESGRIGNLNPQSKLQKK
jgi:oxalyl-CoA decarboxylase